MSSRPREARPGRVVVGCWWLSLLAGGLLVATPFFDVRPAGLLPSTVASYLRQAAGPGANDLRINGIYGSGRSGAWQFVAHLSWRDGDGDVHGGVVELPAGAGSPVGRAAVLPERLEFEEQRGWTLRRFSRAVHGLDHQNAALAFLELAIPATGADSLTFCFGSRGRGTCVLATGDGRRTATRHAELLVDPFVGPLSVRRR